MGRVMGARRRVAIHASVALVRVCSVPLLMAGKIHLLSTLVSSSLLADPALAPTCSQVPRLLCSHSRFSRVFVEAQQLPVRSRFLVVPGSHSKGARAFAEVGVIRAYLRFLVELCPAFVEVVMLPVSPRSLRALYLHSKTYRVSVGVEKLPASPRFLAALYSHSKVVLSSSGF